MLAPTIGAALALSALQEPQEQDPLAHWRAALAALARDDTRHGTFGPTGARLWATRIEARPGCVGDLHYVHQTPGLGQPLWLDFVHGAGARLAVELRSASWQPSHSSYVYRVGGEHGFDVDETKWITGDDVFVSRCVVHGPARFRLAWDSELATEPDAGERFLPLPIGPLCDVDLAVDARVAAAPRDRPVWIEGELADSQVGSTGSDRKAGASGGAVLGSEFGAAAGHTAVWSFGGGDGPQALWLRYARALPGGARFRVDVGNAELWREDAARLLCESSGGWGATAAEFAWARVELGELPAGICELVLTALHDGANTNIDGLLLTGAEVGREALPEPAAWPALDPLRGGLRLVQRRVVVDGVPFGFVDRLARRGRQAIGPGAAGVEGRGERVHVLALPLGDAAALALDGERRPLREALPVRARGLERLRCVTWHAATEAPELRIDEAVVVAITREAASPPADVEWRTGRGRWHGVDTEVVAAVHGLRDRHDVVVPEGATRVFHATVELAGNRVPRVLTRSALAGADPLESHVDEYAGWFARNAPRFSSDDALLERVWTYRWFVVRHNLAWPDAGHLRGPVVYEGRHGSWYPQVITFSAPHIVAEARWLRDPRVFLGNLQAHADNQQADGVFPNLRVDARRFRYTQWIGAAAVDAFRVHDDREALARLLPALVRNVRGNAQRFDRDRDGLLAPGDHYATGMEFQPSFWFHSGYDDSVPATELERPDFCAYHVANASALADAARWLGDAELAGELDAIAATTRRAVLATLWHAEDRFFYSVREHDDDPARTREVIGFYPFRFGLVPADDARYRDALATLVDPAQFWTAFPVASCARSVPVYSAAVQRWPGPGGVVAPCMWNGPMWPHATTLVADAMAEVLRTRRDVPFDAGRLGELLLRYARFHCEEQDLARPLLREYGDGETGANYGCPDYMHSTFCDLLIRHLAGLLPRFGDDLVVRPLPLFAPGEPSARWRIDDIPYHGRRVGIESDGRRLTVRLDGRVLGVGEMRSGLFFGGVLAR